MSALKKINNLTKNDQIYYKKSYVRNLMHFQDEIAHLFFSKRWRSAGKVLIAVKDEFMTECT